MRHLDLSPELFILSTLCDICRRPLASTLTTHFLLFSYMVGHLWKSQISENGFPRRGEPQSQKYKCERIWTDLIRILNGIERNWTDLNGFERIWYGFERIWTNWIRNWTNLNTFEQIWIYLNKEDYNVEQAGAELCQAQVKLGLAKIEIFFNRKLRSSAFSQKNQVVFNLISN